MKNLYRISLTYEDSQKNTSLFGSGVNVIASTVEEAIKKVREGVPLKTQGYAVDKILECKLLECVHFE